MFDFLPELERRIASVSEALYRCEKQPLNLPSPFAFKNKRFVVTGIGMSEGPAKFLVTLLNARLGLSATFTPLSTFLTSTVELKNVVLVIFTENICPNARLALQAAMHAEEMLLFVGQTSAQDEQVSLLRKKPNHYVVELSIQPESESLVRFVGPSVATYLVLQWTCPDLQLQMLPHVLSRIPSYENKIVSDKIVLLTTQGYDAYCQGLAWKWQEALWTALPPIWDALQFSHGPLQSTHEHSMTAVLLSHENDAVEQNLFEHFKQTLVPKRHRVFTLTAQLPAPLSFFEHDMLMNQLILHILKQQPRDLKAWPGRGKDQPLYGIDEKFLHRF